jgi:hypothetical protein
MRHVLTTLLLGVLGLGTGGCNVIGYGATLLPPPTIQPAYDGLNGKTAAVIVWAPTDIDISYPALTTQIGQRLQKRIVDARDNGNRTMRKTLEGLTFTYPTESYVRAFKEDPSLSYLSGEELAGLAGVERVIYVQIGSFTERGGAAPGLVKGVADVGLMVYEVEDPVKTVEEASLAAAKGGAEPGTEVYREQGIRVVFPEKGPAEGSSRLTPDQAYAGLIVLTVEALSERFLEHTEDDF